MNLSPGTSERYRMKRIWERLIFDPGEISDLRARLTSNITLLEAFLTNLTERNTQKSLARLERQVDEQEREQILDWISKDCKWHIDRLKWFIGRHEPGTRKWLFESPEWQTWTSDRGRGTTLFCPGIPGAGKTHASASKSCLETIASNFEECAAFIVPEFLLWIAEPFMWLAASLQSWSERPWS